jgi:hypothetical protein
VAVVTEEPRVFETPVNVVCGEIQAVRNVLPLWDQRGHVIVHSQIGIAIHLATQIAQVPGPCMPGWSKLREIEGYRGGNDEEVAHPGIVVHIPVGGTRKEDAVVATAPGEVILPGGGGEDHPRCTIGVDLEDRDEGALGNPIVDPCSLSPLQHRFLATIQPDPGFQRIGPVVLAFHGGRLHSVLDCHRHGQANQEAPRLHGFLLSTHPSNRSCSRSHASPRAVAQQARTAISGRAHGRSVLLR